jgi:hypothetical protein
MSKSSPPWRLHGDLTQPSLEVRQNRSQSATCASTIRNNGFLIWLVRCRIDLTKHSILEANCKLLRAWHRRRLSENREYAWTGRHPDYASTGNKRRTIFTWDCLLLSTSFVFAFYRRALSTTCYAHAPLSNTGQTNVFVLHTVWTACTCNNGAKAATQYVILLVNRCVDIPLHIHQAVTSRAKITAVLWTADVK